ncbi:hypothetical protein P3S68_014960 [Capsicum galapagoense]
MFLILIPNNGYTISLFSIQLLLSQVQKIVPTYETFVEVILANILLDDDCEAVVGEFGLAKLLDHRHSHVTTAVRGTVGHIASGISLQDSPLIKQMFSGLAFSY